MSSTSKPTPGSPAAVLDVTVRSVTEGRYRYARLHLLWHLGWSGADEIVELVNQATLLRELPPGITPGAVIESGKPPYLPDWLDAAVDAEIARICAGQPTASSAPDQLVGRVAAAICLDVSADISEAAARAAAPDAAETEPAGHHSLIHLGVPDLIDLDLDAHEVERGSTSRH